ncbi:MAG: J domain-containing protein [Deltaproteobacteria bacterium]|nr:J domain-containing protein [Deltaproteobacteria bacterium]MDQ3297898.1 J domain-containing protein [Myxococcota bacterium]
MSTAPAEIAGIGSTQQRLRVSPGFDPLKAAVGPEEYFVLSRIDGSQTLREILFATGLPMDRAVQIVVRLRTLGALLLPGETVAPAMPPPPAAKPVITGRVATSPGVVPSAEIRAPAAGKRPAATGFAEPQPKVAAQPHDLRLPNPTQDELAALAEDNALADNERRRILAMQRLVADPHALLGVPQGADPKMLKRAYFQLSKLIHPDRHYGKKLGSFASRLPLVFEATSRAYAKLTGNDRPRGSGGNDAASEPTQQPQTPQEYAAELYERACQLEVGGDALGAMKLFAAAVRVAPQIRYLRRAASCALAADQPKTALEYAKKAHVLAPNDPSSARLLAASFRAAGKLNDAEEVLVMAMALKSENDVLTAELRNDLAEVRRQLDQT